jgi:tetratricopeptide (TPR) repeat protein
MSSDDVPTLLRDGITAAKAGEQAKARELLTRVVEADENNLQAWLWLSGVVTTLEDREVCLENVLALDPDNEPARKGLDWVREQIAATPEIEPESILPHVETNELRVQEAKVAVDFSDDMFDSPLLCVYCGHLTGEDDKRCPNCKRSLYLSGLKRERPGWLWVGWTVGIVDVFFSAAVLLVLLFILTSALSAAKFGGEPIDIVQLVQMYLGQRTVIPSQAQAFALSVLPGEQFYLRVSYTVFMAIVTLGLPTRRRLFQLSYIATIVIGAAGLYLNLTLNRTFITSDVALTPIQRIVQVVINETLGMFVTLSSVLAGGVLALKVLLVFLMEEDFEKVTERLWSVIDRTVREPTTAFIRAKSYMKRGLWTLAAMYLRRCISLQPAIVDYHLALAESYAHLGRYRQGLEILDQAERLQPGSEIVHQLRDVILGLKQHADLKLAATSADPAGGL